MSNDVDVSSLIPTREISAWVAAQPYLWQMGLLTASELARKTGTFGLGLRFDESDIFRLWHLKLLRADLVRVANRRQWAGLVYHGKDIYGRHLYSDERTLWTGKTSIIGAAARSKDRSDILTPLFHPFRYLILEHLEFALKTHVSPMLALDGKQAYRRISEFQLKMTGQWSKSLDMAQIIEHWNAIASLVMALEPWYSSHFSSNLSLPSYLLTQEDVGARGIEVIS